MQNLLLAGGLVLNNPYPTSESSQKIYYTSFTEQPKTLDPAKSYSSNEYQFIAQIYEPVLHYDYLTRPYKLVPSTATIMPEIHYFDKTGHEVLDTESPTIAQSVYTIHINPGIMYQPHPGFARDEQGHYRYSPLLPDFLDKNNINQLADFKYISYNLFIISECVYVISIIKSQFSILFNTIAPFGIKTNKYSFPKYEG